VKNADKNDPEANYPDSRLALILFRYSLLLEQGELARAAHIAPSQLSVYERGDRAAPREVLEKAAVAADFPVELLDSLLWGIRSFRAVRQGKSRANRVFADGMAAELIALARLAGDAILEPLRLLQPAGDSLPEPADAEALWATLAPQTADDRRMLVEELEEYWTLPLSERVAAESLAKTADQPKEALELAELAALIAKRVPGGAALHSRLRGYAEVHQPNES